MQLSQLLEQIPDVMSAPPQEQHALLSMISPNAALSPIIDVEITGVFSDTWTDTTGKFVNFGRYFSVADMHDLYDRHPYIAQRFVRRGNIPRPMFDMALKPGHQKMSLFMSAITIVYIQENGDTHRYHRQLPI